MLPSSELTGGEAGSSSMKADELGVCTSVLEDVLEGAHGDTKTISLSEQQHSALQKLLKVVSGLSRAAEHPERLGAKQPLSLEQRQYLSNFGDSTISSESDLRRGQKLEARPSFGPKCAPPNASAPHVSALASSQTLGPAICKPSAAIPRSARTLPSYLPTHCCS